LISNKFLQNKGVGDRRCSSASSLHVDLSNLVTWAHSHGAICSQIPTLETAQTMDHPHKENSVLWICGGGHAYYWHCGKLDMRNREENEGVRKRSGSAEASSRKADLYEKRFRMTPFFERAKADAASTESCSRYPGVTQRDDTVYMINNESPAEENKMKSKSMKSRVTAEEHLATSGSAVNTDSLKVTFESEEDLHIMSQEQQHTSDEDDQGHRIKQNILSELPEDAAAAVDLQSQNSQTVAFNQPTATQTSSFDPTRKPPMTPACIPKSSASNQKSLDSSPLSLGSPNAAGPVTQTSAARNSPESAIPKEHFKSDCASKTEAESQRESPTPATFFEFDTTVDVKQQLQLSPLEHGTPGMGSGGTAPEPCAGEAEPPGPECTAHPSSSVSPGSENGNHPPASSSTSELEQWNKKRSRKRGNIKAFKDWLVLHHPAELREIHTLPPQDLSSYLALFYSSAKSQNGADFSSNTLHFFQLSIEHYLKDHNYQYSTVKGVEFRAAREALKLRQQQLSQKEREGKWGVLESLTEEDVDSLCRKEILCKQHPEGLLSLMLTHITRGFGARTHSGGRTLFWGQLTLRKAEGELEWLEWKDELGARAGAGEQGPRLLARPHAPEGCPVA
ncbi:PREDICTED: uncharacterized protein KIAA1958-like, partial [Merops nubicus]|uniref:uncharacterized protein KIAA1958-like n=1 Tax=Merops nubicus TaxID=57421 RepID=UPI0004F0B91B